MAEVWKEFRRELDSRGVGVPVRRMQPGHHEQAVEERACTELEDPTRMPSEMAPPLVVLEPLSTEAGF